MALVEIAIAEKSDLDQINEMFNQCKDDLMKKWIFQWDDTYPNRDYFEECIDDKVLYVLKEDNQVVGAIVFNEWQSEEWDEVDWLFNDSRSLVIHSFCVHPKKQSNGLGGRLLKFAEEYAKAQHYTTIRLDAFSGNASSCKFYEKRGYEERGFVHFASKPKGHQKYICYEKLL